jgi:hypothetical protein
MAYSTSSSSLIPKHTSSHAPPKKKSLDNLTNEDDHDILDHCNGLLLLWWRVVNPATRQWVALPPFPQPCVGMEGFRSDFFLAYDPLMSPHHYMVIHFPLVPITYVDIKFTRTRNGHHPYSQPTSSHQPNRLGRRYPLYVKERLTGPLPTCGPIGHHYTAAPSISKDNFMYIAKIILL